MKADTLTIMQAQFVRPLRPVLDIKILSRATPEEIAKIIDAYWAGVRKVLPEAFEEPKRYVLQKGPGGVALHRVLPVEMPREYQDRTESSVPRLRRSSMRG